MQSSFPLLLAKAQEGDADAMAALFDQYFNSLVEVLTGRLRCQDHAEDAAAEAFYKALTAIQNYNGEENQFLAWLTKLGIRAARACSRQCPDNKRVDLERLVESPATFSMAPVNGFALKEAMQKLPPNDRAVMNLLFYHGMTEEEVAERLTLSAAAVHERVESGLNTMKRILTA